MEDRLRELLQDLGTAINESLSDSDSIAEAIGEIKRAGYDVFLVLEATIGFKKRGDPPDEGEDKPEVRIDEAPPPGAPGSTFDAERRPKFTAQDLKFAAALKISLDDDPPRGTKR